MYKKILFAFLIISLFASMYLFRHYFNIFYFQNDINTIAVNIETNDKDNVYVCYNKNCDEMTFNNGVYSHKLNQKKAIFYEDIVDNIEIVSSKPLKYSAISVFLGKKVYYFNDVISKEVDFNSQKAYSINLPVKNNNKTFLQKAGVYFESIFYQWYFYLPFYIFALIYLIKYKPQLKTNIWIIIFLALFLRFSHINFIPLWNDELYTLTHISDMGQFNLLNSFADPGNPPLFFIISNIWLRFFGKDIVLIRLLPLIIGILGIYSIYFVINKMLDEKIALCASFLAAINIFLIVESNEIRSYTLSMLLLIWGMYYFFKLKKDFSLPNLITYSALSILIINTHYYCVLYIIFNFLAGMILFKDKVKFLISNIIIFLSFLPYFIYSNKTAMSETFNTWLERPSLEVLNNHIIFYFGNIVFFILTIAFCVYVYKKLNKEKKEIFLYTNLSIIFVFVCALLFSAFFKPVLFERYFCIFLPYLIINTAIFLSLEFKPLILLIILLFSINMPKYENFNLFSNINNILNYAKYDFKNYQNPYFVIPDNIDYIKYFPDIPKEKTVVSNYGVREDIDLIEFYLSKTGKKENVVLYLPEICINSKIKYSDTLDVKRIETAIVPIYKVVIK